MNIRRHLILLIVSTFILPLIAFSASSNSRDKLFTDLLVGTWLHIKKDPEIQINAEITYNKDGTCSGKGVIKTASKTEKISYNGTWYILNGNIFEKVISSNEPDIIGIETADQIISIDQKKYTFKTGADEIETLTRK